MSAVLKFGPFSLDTGKRQLKRDDAPVRVTSKCLDILICLASKAGATVLREDLIREVWGDELTSEATLTQHMFMVRRLLGDEGQEHEYVVTIPKAGYRFIAPVECIAGESVSKLTAAQLCANAQDFWERRSEGAFRAAIALYEQALQVEPASADAHAGLAVCHMLSADYFYTNPKAAMERCEFHARKALAIDPGCARANVALGKHAIDYKWDYADAARHLAIGLEADPTDHIGLFLSAWVLILQRRFDEATLFLERAVPKDPGNLLLQQCRGLISLYSGDYRRSISELRAATERAEDLWLATVMLGQGLYLTGQVEEAISYWERVWHAEYDGFMRYQANVRFFAAGYLIFAFFRSGQGERAAQVWDRIRRIERTNYVPAMLHAVACSGARQFEEAHRWIALSRENRECWYTQLAVEPFLSDIQSLRAL